MLSYPAPPPGDRAIDLGRRWEHLARRIVFDISGWVEAFGAGSVRLLHQRQDDAAPYPVTIARTDADGATVNDQTGTLVLWDVTRTDTAQVCHYGRAELRYYAGHEGAEEFLVKSCLYKTVVADALGASLADAPEEEREWLGVLLDAADNADSQVDAAQSSAADAADAANTAHAAAIAARSAQDGAEAARDAVTNLSVSATTLVPGSAATATKTINAESGAVSLEIGVPRGDTGATGPQGPKGDTGTFSPEDLQRIEDLETENALIRELIEGIDAPIYRTASGNPVTFSDGAAANVKSLTVTLTPSQSQTPTPESPVPIDGATSVTLGRSGKNITDRPNFSAPNSYNYYHDLPVNHFAIPGVAYTLSYDVTTTVEPFHAVIGVGASGFAGSLIWAAFSRGGRISVPFTANAAALLSGDKSSRLWFRPVYYSSVTAYSLTVKNVQLELGGTASDYEPYDGQTAVVQFVDSANNDAPITVYGGVLTLAPSAATLTVTYGNIPSYDGETVPDGWLSSTGELSTGAQVVYPLDPADYQTYQLTAVPFATRSGFNVIDAAAGTSPAYRASPAVTLSVDYRADLSLTYAELETTITNVILSLGAGI